MFTILRTLINTPSVSGREEKIRELIKKYITPLCDEVYTDALGNLIAHKKGSLENAPKVMLCAHMDEIGFLVTFIEDDGFIRIAPVGGISPAAAAFSEVVSENGIAGVIVPDSETKPADYKLDKFYIDIGAKNKKEAEKRVKIGDFFVCRPSLTRLVGKRVAGRPLDDRIGCAVLIDVAEYFTKNSHNCDLYYVFSVQEEVGCRGAKTAAFGISADYGLVFDVTGTGDVPTSKPMACKVGDGAAIKIKDTSVICHKDVVDKLIELAEANRINHQTEILTYGGTDTSAIQMTGSGAKVGALSIPSRYIHSGVELCDLSDAEACAKLAEKFIESI